MYDCQIKIWSEIGNTPITKRKGAYCDELYSNTIQVLDPEDAKNIIKELIRETEHAVSGHYYLPGYPNQNTRSNFVR